MARLTATAAKAARTPGKLYDTGGLYLNIAAGGSRSWIQRVTIDGKRREIGLGGFPAVSLAQARRKCETNRSAVANGSNPLAAKQAPKLPTFRQAAEQYIEVNATRWKNPKEAVSWRGGFSLYANPAFGDTRIDKVSRADVLGVLLPIWTAKPACARKLRQRIKIVFAFGMAHGWLDINAAGDLINAALPSTPAVTSHFRALAYQEVADALISVDASTAGLAARLCFRWTVLTACRSGEARAARWDDIDQEAKTWTIPAERMKSARAHRVPLSDAALDVLQEARALADDSGWVFPSPVTGRALTDMALTKVLKSIGLADRATVHGFRASFRTWTLEQTDTPWAVAEAALAHTIGNPTEQAYARSDLFERRRALMQDWAAYVTQ